MEKKRCTTCNKDRPYEFYYKDPRYISGRKSQCKVCINNKAKERRARDPEKYRELQRKYQRENRKRYRQYCNDWRERNLEKAKASGWMSHERSKLRCLEHYGGACVFCGAEDPDILCFDHINDDGAKRRGEHGACGVDMITKEKYPEDIQVLCANCNLKKEMRRRRRERGSNKYYTPLYGS